jgi:hypothetical protein
MQKATLPLLAKCIKIDNHGLLSGLKYRELPTVWKYIFVYFYLNSLNWILSIELVYILTDGINSPTLFDKCIDKEDDGIE